MRMIFEDPSGKRRRRAKRIGIVIALASVLPIAAVVASRMPAPPRTPIARSPFRALPTPSTWSPEPKAPRPPPRLSPEYVRHLARLDARSEALVSRLPSDAIALPAESLMVFAVDSPDSTASIESHRAALDRPETMLVMDWLRLSRADCEVEVLSPQDARGKLGLKHARVFARLANLDGDRWTSAETSALLADESARRCAARAVATELEALGADGVNVDFEALAPEDAAGLVSFVAELRGALHPDGRIVTVDVSGQDAAYDLPRLGKAADAVVLMAYDEHHLASAPGPIASRAFIEARIDAALRAVPADRLIAGLGAYCLDWSRARAGADFSAVSMGVPEAMSRAALAGATPRAIEDTGNVRFDYRDGRGIHHQVWCLDGIAVADALAVFDDKGISRRALWRAGTEDPSTWALLDADSIDARRAALLSAEAPSDPVVQGTGDVLVRLREKQAGRREIAFDSQGHVASARYLSVPSAGVIERLGDSEGNGVVLTFDDGPDPDWTPAVLDALSELHAPATFFVLGSAAMQHPDLVRRAVREGHLVASHSYDHPHMDRLDRAAARDELDRTARVLQSLSGRETVLYRAPYTAFVDAASAREISAHDVAWDAGYAYVAASSDPRDWDTRDANLIAARIISDVRAGGRVVVMHDGGGPRQATVAALKIAVPRLRALGYEIVSLDRYAGLSRDGIAPRLDRDERLVAMGTLVAAEGGSWGGRALSGLFAICTILAALRILSLAALILRERIQRGNKGAVAEYAPQVTVLVPAYNEGKVIADSVRSLLRSEYTNLEILVIDDGSSDDTAAVVEALAASEPRVRCLRKSNGGKASAANFGMERARGEIVIAVDADTVVSKDAIGRMVAHFSDPEVTAVCGNVEVGNVRSLLTAFQAIEYVTSQNFDRRAFAALNCIAVVPGALGAWRREAVVSIGGYGKETLVEDADLTLCVLRAGGKITYEPRAIGRTEAPETLGALWKQRFRWTYGTYQCLAKHKQALFRGPLGWVALPNALVFQVLFPLVSPIGDLALLHAIVTGEFTAILSGYLGFLAMDFIASAMAFTLDRKPFRWLPLLLIQRFTYRQFLYLVSLRAMIAVLAGSCHGWRKLERTGSVLTPEADSLPPLPAQANPSWAPPAA